MSFAAGTNGRAWEAAGDENQAPQKLPWSVCLPQFCPGVENESKRWRISIFSRFLLAPGSCTHPSPSGEQRILLCPSDIPWGTQVFTLSVLQLLPQPFLPCWCVSCTQLQQHLWSWDWRSLKALPTRLVLQLFSDAWKSQSVWRAGRDTQNSISSHRKHIFLV